jgi:hypothetical protein
MKKVIFFLGCLLTGTHSGWAVCIDSQTGISGYQIPLDEEINAAPKIAIVQVLKEKALSEDVSDPIGVTAYLYTARVLRQLKGAPLKVMKLYSENTSGGYPMDVGEKYLLFISEDEHLWIDNCGHSAPLWQSSATLRQVEKKLGMQNHAGKDARRSGQ